MCTSLAHLFESAFRETPTKEFLLFVGERKNFKRNKKNCISFLATRANNNNSKTTQNFNNAQGQYVNYINGIPVSELSPEINNKKNKLN